MRFHNYWDIPSMPGAKVFRRSVIQSLIGVFVITFLMALASWVGMHGSYENLKVHFPSFIFFWIAGALGFFALLTFPTALATLHPANFLLKYDPERILIKFRSYLNRHFDKNDAQALSLFPNEIAWVRRTSERKIVPASKGTTEINYYYLDIQLKGDDTSLLEECLQKEHARQAPEEGWVRTKYHDYPVTVPALKLIRLQWNGVTPDLKSALKILGQSFPCEAENQLKNDFNQLKDFTNDEKEARVIQLVKQGEIISACGSLRQPLGSIQHRPGNWWIKC